MVDLSREQDLSINALKRAIKRTLNAGLVIVMQDGAVTIHFNDDWDTRTDMDCGCYGLKGADGEWIDPIASFDGIEH